MQRKLQVQDYIGTSGAANLVGVSTKTIHRWIDSGRLRAVGRLANGGPNDPLILLKADVLAVARQRNGSETLTDLEEQIEVWEPHQLTGGNQPPAAAGTPG